ISFSLWRAAFLADREVLPEKRLKAAEKFLRKILVDNQISFVQDRLWRDWTFNYYVEDARARLELLDDDWDDLKLGQLYPAKGQRTSRKRWDLLQKAFAKAVNRLADDLES